MEIHILRFCDLGAAILHHCNKFHFNGFFIPFAAEARYIKAFATCLTYQLTSFGVCHEDIKMIKIRVIVITPAQTKIAVLIIEITFELNILDWQYCRIIIGPKNGKLAKFKLIVAIISGSVYEEIYFGNRLTVK